MTLLQLTKDLNQAKLRIIDHKHACTTQAGYGCDCATLDHLVHMHENIKEAINSWTRKAKNGEPQRIV